MYCDFGISLISIFKGVVSSYFQILIFITSTGKGKSLDFPDFICIFLSIFSSNDIYRLSYY